MKSLDNNESLRRPWLIQNSTLKINTFQIMQDHLPGSLLSCLKCCWTASWKVVIPYLKGIKIRIPSCHLVILSLARPQALVILQRVDIHQRARVIECDALDARRIGGE